MPGGVMLGLFEDERLVRLFEDERLVRLFEDERLVRLLEDERLVEMMYFVFTRMPGECYRRRLGAFLLCLCDVFPALINSLAC